MNTFSIYFFPPNITSQALDQAVNIFHSSLSSHVPLLRLFLLLFPLLPFLQEQRQGRPVDSMAHVLTLSVLEEQVLLTSVGCVEQGAWAQVFLCYRNGSSLTLSALQITFIDHQLLNQKLYHSLFRLFFSVSSSLENQLSET